MPADLWPGAQHFCQQRPPAAADVDHASHGRPVRGIDQDLGIRYAVAGGTQERVEAGDDGRMEVQVLPEPPS